MSTPQPPAWHLIAGPTGAGKSTEARRLADALGAVRFSIDEWMNTLFWPDCPQKNDLPWALERVSRAETQMAAVATQLMARGVSSVLDLGFSVEAQRAAWLARARASSGRILLHVLAPDAAERWRRVQQRNAGTADTFTFHVDRTMFDLMETHWQPPTPDELARFDQR